MGRAHRALPGVGHGRRRVVLAEQGEQVEPVQVARRLPRRGSRPLRREELGDVRMGEGGARGHRRGLRFVKLLSTNGTAVEILDRFGLGD